MVASVHNKTRDGVGANKAFCELIKCWAFCWKKVEQKFGEGLYLGGPFFVLEEKST